VSLPEETGPALASVVLAGACLGFLPHNFYPARIFMGDTGSMLLGLLLSYIPISAISSLDYNSLQNKANRYGELLPLLLPAAVLVIPYIDLLRAVVRRTRAGLSPFAADRKHLHHQMLEIGHSHRSSVLILYAWAAVFAGAIVGLSIVTVKLAVLAGVTLAAVVVLGLLSIPKLRWWQRDRAPDSTSASDAAREGRPTQAASRPDPLAVGIGQHPGSSGPGSWPETSASLDWLNGRYTSESRPTVGGAAPDDGAAQAATSDVSPPTRAQSEATRSAWTAPAGTQSASTDPAQADPEGTPSAQPSDATVPMPIARASGKMIP